WGASGDHTVHIKAHLSPPQDQPADLVVCAVKARYVGAAAKAMTPLVGAQTLVLTIQNGLGSAEVVAGIVGPERLIVGVAQGFGASLQAPGCVHHNDMKAIKMGAYQGLPMAQVQDIVAAWAAAGFDATAAADIAALQWEKLICNAAYSAPCALTGLSVGAVMDHPHMGTISRAAASEAYAIAIALGVNLSFTDPIATVREFAARMPNAKPSVLLDLEAGRPSEVDAINGAVANSALAIGAQAPVNATLTGLVQTLESQGLTQEKP
ncbi:MAG: ketopantoate reductase family protein, partial [Pseudomonadales bacterium]